MLLILPVCTFAQKWEKKLLKKINSTSKIVVTGYDLKDDSLKIVKLLDISDKKSITDFLNSIKIDDDISGTHCACSGDMFFDFYDDKSHLATLSYHHSIKLRWKKGRWRGDALLHFSSAQKITDWLFKYGIDEPKEQLKRVELSEKAKGQRFETYNKLLKPYGIGDVQSFKKLKKLTKMLKKAIPDDNLRLNLHLTMLGSNYNSWEKYAGLDGYLKNQIDQFENSTFNSLFKTKDISNAGIRGFIRWIVHENDGKRLSSFKLSPVINSIAQEGLTHPVEINRKMTLWLFEKYRDENINEILINFLKGEYLINEISEEELASPGGAVVSKPIARLHSDKSFAALILAKNKVKDAMPIILKLKEEAKGHEIKDYEEALKILKDI